MKSSDQLLKEIRFCHETASYAKEKDFPEEAEKELLLAKELTKELFENYPYFAKRSSLFNLGKNSH
jgi:hypothetical protein